MIQQLAPRAPLVRARSLTAAVAPRPVLPTRVNAPHAATVAPAHATATAKTIATLAASLGK